MSRPSKIRACDYLYEVTEPLHLLGVDLVHCDGPRRRAFGVAMGIFNKDHLDNLTVAGIYALADLLTDCAKAAEESRGIYT